jgi:putative selenate reductase FAD-binding subunit
MIIEYQRPTTLQEALELLRRAEPTSLPLGGGTVLNQPDGRQIAAIDLQALGLNTIERRGNTIEMGATLTLQAMLESEMTPTALKAVILHEATHNLRQVATVAGTLVAADGRSPFATALLALDAALTLQPAATDQPAALDQPGDETVGLGDLLPMRSERLLHRLITQVAVPSNARLAYEYVARTPADRPIVCVAAAQWPSGRTRLAVGGFGPAPRLAFDGSESEGGALAARSVCSQAQDSWASAEYRQEVAQVLAQRCISSLVTND